MKSCDENCLKPLVENPFVCLDDSSSSEHHHHDESQGQAAADDEENRVRNVGIVDTGVGCINQIEISSDGVKLYVALKLHDGIDNDEEAEGDDGQGAEGDQEAEHVGAGDPVQAAVRTPHTVNPELVHHRDI